MNGDDNWLIHEHSLYEDLLSQCTEAVEIEDWKTAGSLFKRLVTHLKRHMAIEDEVLYPAYEASAEAPQGPTGALREEHDRIAQLVTDMARVLETRDSDYVLECMAHLERQMIKHHEKEEDIFLPMASHILDARREEISQQLAEFNVSKIRRKWDI
ncbi:MAG TPA: hemerythrin domain-containing protein [Gammaproteobacteria bacterium]|nr:hemerythrin domain-containing protein [Gammaproteobacteria bacterium]